MVALLRLHYDSSTPGPSTWREYGERIEGSDHQSELQFGPVEYIKSNDRFASEMFRTIIEAV
jgi:hypothetical protein